jgi:NDP-sugar pyrophosphorylase family protein
MKALIILREKDCSWLRPYFQDSHPGMIAICNKPLLGFLVDFAVLNGCSGVRILMDEPGSDVKGYFGNGSRWGIDMSYGSFKSGTSIDTILTQNHSFSKMSSLLVMDGFFFIHYDKFKDYHQWHNETNSNLASVCNTGSLVYTQNAYSPKNISSVQTKTDFALSSLESIDDIFQISTQVLTAEQSHYVLPGYAESEQKILKGRDVEVSGDAIIKEPVIIGNHVRLRSNSTIGPGVVLGSNVIIDEGAEIAQTVVMAESYIGKNLTVKDKIIDGKYIISPKTGERLQIEERFLLSTISLQSMPELLDTACNRIAALFLASLQLIPFLLLRTLCLLQNDYTIKKRDYLINGKGKTVSLAIVANSRGSFWGRFFRVLSLHKFPLLGMAVNGEIRLIGNALLPVNTKNQQFLTDFREYVPGVFTFTEHNKNPADSKEAEIEERFYAGNRSLLADGRMLLHLLFTGAKRTHSEKEVS